jgi:putative monooxygenase
MSTRKGTPADLPSPRSLILRPTKMPAHDRGGGARTIPLVTRRLGVRGFINGITIFEPGASVPLHSHNCDESILILEGRAIAEIDGVEYDVAAHEVTYMPANVPHRFRNASTTEPMQMMWTYASIDATRTIIATGDTRPIEAEHRVTGEGT